MIQQSHLYIYIQRNKIIIAVRYLYSHVYCSVITMTKVCKQLRCSLMDKWVKKNYVNVLYNGIYISIYIHTQTQSYMYIHVMLCINVYTYTYTQKTEYYF